MMRTVRLKIWPWALNVIVIFFTGVLGSCHENNELIFETEGYIVGGYHCLGNTVISTPYGSGRTYLIETVSSEPEFLLVFGVSEDLFDFPDNWMGYYSFSEEQKRNHKIKFRYRNITRPRDDKWYSFICTTDYPELSAFYPSVVVISARGLDLKL